MSTEGDCTNYQHQHDALFHRHRRTLPRPAPPPPAQLEDEWLLRGGSLDSAASCLPVGWGVAEQAEALGRHLRAMMDARGRR
jgi:hypothetical protein